MDEPHSLTSVAERCLQQWGLQPTDDSFETHSSLIWPVRYQGCEAILKIVHADDDEANAAEILKLYDGHGAIRLLRHEGTCQLLEKVVSPPSQPSLEMMVLSGRDDEATHIICDVIDKLHARSQGHTASVPHTMFVDRIAETQQYMDNGRVSQEDMPLFKEGIQLSRQLLQETEPTHMLLHGDIHHFNVMCSSERGWLALDPKGIWGPRVYEYVIALCNPTLHTEIVANSQRMGRQADIMAERSNIGRRLILQFAFIHALQVAAWCLSLPDKTYWLACAKTARSSV